MENSKKSGFSLSKTIAVPTAEKHSISNLFLLKPSELLLPMLTVSSDQILLARPKPNSLFE
ncbi:hypothetical protein BpHYR1_047180 [Brachionus plicatilis]|uniref:Uncharacterized protein n=1 Tax=Brachionus plicatilis TaxID=10195 RepID=A0A3M7S1T6_BRAPC|nr:hypothetical protein BpHYR1_047180 [Brachionus plicatilis]